MRRQIYVASSWRNRSQPGVVKALRNAGHLVYDFRHPKPGDEGFHWEEIDPDWQVWTVDQFREALRHPVAQAGFKSDWEAMEWADTGLLLMPAGRSAHLEAGYFVGAGKDLVILLSEGEPELMYKMADCLAATLDDALAFLGSRGPVQPL